jgi:hypothetical protein
MGGGGATANHGLCGTDHHEEAVVNIVGVIVVDACDVEEVWLRVKGSSQLKQSHDQRRSGTSSVVRRLNGRGGAAGGAPGVEAGVGVVDGGAFRANGRVASLVAGDLLASEITTSRRSYALVRDMVISMSCRF